MKYKLILKSACLLSSLALVANQKKIEIQALKLESAKANLKIQEARVLLESQQLEACKLKVQTQESKLNKMNDQKVKKNRQKSKRIQKAQRLRRNRNRNRNRNTPKRHTKKEDVKSSQSIQNQAAPSISSISANTSLSNAFITSK